VEGEWQVRADVLWRPSLDLPIGGTFLEKHASAIEATATERDIFVEPLRSWAKPKKVVAKGNYLVMASKIGSFPYEFGAIRMIEKDISCLHSETVQSLRRNRHATNFGPVKSTFRRNVVHPHLDDTIRNIFSRSET
jgi:hypothetical protein